MASVQGGSGGFWNSYRTVNTPKGIYRSFYHPGAPNEFVRIFAPGEAATDVATPSLGDWQLENQNGQIVICYVKIEGDQRVEVFKPTGIMVGEATTPPVTPPPATNNAALVAQIRVLLDQVK
jgi:hypothetical protein